MIEKINNSLSYGDRFVTVKGGITKNSYTHRVIYSETINISGFQETIDGNLGSFGNGSGVSVTTGGSLIFDSRNNGGSLSEVILVNRSSSIPAYVYINETGVDASSQAVLNPGESKHYTDGPIRYVFAAGVGSTSIVQVEGVRVNNHNAI